MTESYHKEENAAQPDRSPANDYNKCYYLAERGWFVLRQDEFRAEYIYFTYQRIGPGRGISTPHIGHIETDLKGNLDTLLQEGDTFQASLYLTVKKRALEKKSVGYTTPD